MHDTDVMRVLTRDFIENVCPYRAFQLEPQRQTIDSFDSFVRSEQKSMADDTRGAIITLLRVANGPMHFESSRRIYFARAQVLGEIR